jgi:hypothetical protein
MQEIVISLVADVALNFLHNRHADLYFGLVGEDGSLYLYVVLATKR